MLIDNRYILGNKLAAGGTANVFIALDIRLDRLVALKILNIDSEIKLNNKIIKKFNLEAIAIAQINSDNIINIYDQGIDNQNKIIFIAMELVTGGNLRQLLKTKGAMPPYAAIVVMSDVLSGLTAAHQKNIIHRDIKPENILFTNTGKIKLADFGIAKELNNTITNSNIIAGTPAYLSPEQITKSTPISNKSDIYSSGIVFYELLTGQKPFLSHNDFETAMLRINSPMPKASENIAGVPIELDAIIQKATQINPQNRYTSTTEFLNELINLKTILKIPNYNFSEIIIENHNTADIKKQLQEKTAALSSTHLNPTMEKTTAYYNNLNKSEFNYIIIIIIIIIGFILYSIGIFI